MAKLHNDWQVLPHEPLTEIEPRLLTVVGQIPMPLGNFPRRMTVVGLPRKRTAIFSPIPLREDAMKRIETLGDPAFLIIPNGGHRLDSLPFKVRYPKAKVIAAKGSQKQVGEAVKVDANVADLGKDVDLVSVGGMGDAELAMLVHRSGGATLIVNDIIGNVAHPKGLGARIMARLTGFGPKPRVPRLLLMRYVKDKAALAAQLREWSAISDLTRIIPSHGDILANPQVVLRRLADSLR